MSLIYYLTESEQHAIPSQEEFLKSILQGCQQEDIKHPGETSQEISEKEMYTLTQEGGSNIIELIFSILRNITIFFCNIELNAAETSVEDVTGEGMATGMNLRPKTKGNTYVFTLTLQGNSSKQCIYVQ